MPIYFGPAPIPTPPDSFTVPPEPEKFDFSIGANGELTYKQWIPSGLTKPADTEYTLYPDAASTPPIPVAEHPADALARVTREVVSELAEYAYPTRPGVFLVSVRSARYEELVKAEAELAELEPIMRQLDIDLLGRFAKYGIPTPAEGYHKGKCWSRVVSDIAKLHEREAQLRTEINELLNRWDGHALEAYQLVDALRELSK